MSKYKQNIFLIGPMGSGKTTIGKQLANKFGLDFFDSDHELERLTGASVNLIFDLEGGRISPAGTTAAGHIDSAKRRPDSNRGWRSM